MKRILTDEDELEVFERAIKRDETQLARSLRHLPAVLDHAIPGLSQAEGACEGHNHTSPPAETSGARRRPFI
jgi:hypothetical protein